MAKSETHSRGTLEAIVPEHDEGRLVTVVRCIRETGTNREEMWSETILAISDILAARNAGGGLLDAFDAIPLRISGRALWRCTRGRFGIRYMG